MKRLVRIATVALCMTAGTLAWAQPVSPVLQEIETAFANVSEAIRPFVVNIDTRSTSKAEDEQNPEQFQDIFRFFGIPFESPEGQRPRRQRVGQASGFIFDREGHIITNNHVVEGASNINVKLWNGQQHTATVVGTDPDTDIAVIKIDNGGTDLPVAPLGNSDNVRVGQYAIAAGSPRGFEGSFSFGHISALGRDLNLPEDIRFQNFLQTDAAINLGNSGGPLCNIAGEVVGINIAIVFGANSLGFAIPINTAKNIVPTLIAEGRIVRGYLGVRVTTVDQYAEALNLPDPNGAFVAEVPSGTPAEKAGIQPYDVVRQVNGAPVTNPQDLIRLISEQRPGAQVTLQVFRNGQPMDIPVTLEEFPHGAAAKASPAEERQMLGLRLQNIPAEMAQRLGVQGVAVTEVTPDSPAEEAGITEGDMIVEVGQRKVTNVEEFQTALRERATPGKSLLLGVMRPSGERGIVVLKVPADAVFQ